MSISERDNVLLLGHGGSSATVAPIIPQFDCDKVLDNEPQPDALFRIEGGTSRISEDDYIEGSPELVVEIAASSASKDLHDKLRAYRRNGVQEYLVWQIYEQQLNWFSLQAGEYVLLAANNQDVICSPVFPGLWLAEPALLQGDLAAVLTCLQQGLQTPEHAA